VLHVPSFPITTYLPLHSPLREHGWKRGYALNQAWALEVAPTLLLLPFIFFPNAISIYFWIAFAPFIPQTASVHEKKGKWSKNMNGNARVMRENVIRI
jgi:hypothetical protein